MSNSREPLGGNVKYVAASLVFGFAMLICTIIASSTFVKVKGFGRTISVTGAAFKPITSDYVVWEGSITVAEPLLQSAYLHIKNDLTKVEEFFQDQGFEPKNYTVGTIQIRRKTGRDQEVVGYQLRQTVTVELAEIDRITRLANEASSLIERGVEFESGRPRYLFTGLDDLKIEMIRAATENAKLRAENLAETTGHSIGAPTSAHVGVFQIRPLHSQEVSGMGISDVTSIEKEIVSTVHASFLID